jgi:hypothetical protein
MDVGGRESVAAAAARAALLFVVVRAVLAVVIGFTAFMGVIGRPP